MESLDSVETNHTTRHPLSQMPLWTVLIIPFIFIIITVVGLSSYLSYHSSQRAINNIAEQNSLTVIEDAAQSFY